MQLAEATYDGIALEERVGSGEASNRISDAEIASVHESAEVCLGDMVAADAVYSVPQAYADRITNKTVSNGAVYDFDPREFKREGEERIKRLKEEIGNEPIVGIEDRVAFRFVKRSFDIVFSAAVLVCFSLRLLRFSLKLMTLKGRSFLSKRAWVKTVKHFKC